MRNATAIRVMLDVAQAAGMSPTACLSGTGLDPADLLARNPVVGAEQELIAIGNLVAWTGDRPGLGTQAGRPVQLGTLGVYGLAMMSSGTVRELVAVALRQGLHRFSWGMLDVRVDERHAGIEAVFDETSVPEHVRNFVVERDLVFSMAVLDLLLGPRRGITVTTTLPAARLGALWEAVGRHRVVPGGCRNVIALAASMLDEQLPNSDPFAAVMCEQQCEELLERALRHAPPGTTRAKVEAELRRLPATAWSVEEVAAARFVHPRTLSRVLAAEGTSFRAILDEARERSATALLTETDETVGQIARRLGYADAHSFARAYKRWTGRTPRAARHGNVVTTP